MRMISATKPKVPQDMGSYRLDALELLPCGGTADDSSCLLVRYFDIQRNHVEGDHFFHTASEALEYAQEVYGVERWKTDDSSEFCDAKAIFTEVLMRYMQQLETGSANG